MSRVRIAPVVTTDDQEAFGAVHRLADPRTAVQQFPRGDGLLAWDRGEPVACCSLSVAVDLVGAPGTSGLVGHYAATSDVAGPELLRHTVQSLAAKGAVRVLGPMDGSTWARYRLAQVAQPEDPLGNPPFFLGEPQNPWTYPGHFDRAGFKVAADYQSRAFRLFPAEDGHVGDDEPELPAALSEIGITVSELDPELLEQTLREVHAMSLDAFADNAYYSPIAVEKFAAPFLALRPLIDPRLVLLARNREGLLVSLLFSYPDPLFTKGGRPVRVIVKTLATATRYRGARIARYLLERVRARARHFGHEEVIHALMHVANTSMRLSGEQHSELFRRYSLYERTL